MTESQRAALEEMLDSGEGNCFAIDGRVLRSLLENGWIVQPEPGCSGLVLTDAGREALGKLPQKGAAAPERK